MAKKNFLFWVFNKDKEPLYVDDKGAIQKGDPATLQKPDGSAAALKQSPDGWKDILIKYGRNIKYWGLFRDFTVPMNFKADGARLISNAMWNSQGKGIESIFYLGISKLNRLVFPYIYETWYKGELDFSKYKQKNNDVVVSVMEGGLSKFLKAYEGTTYEIPIDTDPQAVNVVMDGINFKSTHRFEIPENVIPGVNLHKFIPLNYLTTEGTSIGVTAYSVNGGSYSSLDYTSPNYFLSVVDPASAHFKFNITFRALTGGSIRFWLHTQTRELEIKPTTSISNNIITYSFDFTWALLAGENVYLAAKLDAIVSALEMRLEEFTVSFDNKYKSTIVKSLTPFRLFQKLTEKMTNGMFTVKSSFLSSIKDLVYTSGQALRNHEGDLGASAHGSVIKISMNDFFKSLVLYGVGLGIENDKLIIEKIDYFFGTDVAMHLGEVSEQEVTIAEDLMYNTIKVGYPNQTYDSVNGLDEFNVTQKYTTPITRVVKELDLVSPVRADMYGIELTRVNLDGKNTTDSSADNDSFFLSVTPAVSLLPSFLSANKTVSSDIQNPVTFNVLSANPDFNVNVGQDEFTYTGVQGRNVKVSGSIRFEMYDKDLVLSVKKNGVTVKDFPVISNVQIIFFDTSFLIQQNDILSIGVTNTSLFPDISYADMTIDLMAQVITNLRREVYTNISGLLEPNTAFNIELSPKRILLNNGRYLHSILDKHDSDFIKFQTGEKNSELSTTLAGVTITEKSDLQIANLGKKLFLPYYFNITTEVPLNFRQLMNVKMYDKVTWTNKGILVYGYMWDGGFKDATREKQNWKLLAAPENDMSKFIV